MIDVSPTKFAVGVNWTAPCPVSSNSPTLSTEALAAQPEEVTRQADVTPLWASGAVAGRLGAVSTGGLSITCDELVGPAGGFVVGSEEKDAGVNVKLAVCAEQTAVFGAGWQTW